MNTQYRKNLKDAMTACKDYTDTQIVQAKEEIYWHIGEYSVTTSDDNTSASVKTVPSNATRCKIKRVYGNTQKLNPTTASDSTSAMMKTMPSTVYDFDVSKVEGNSEKSENLCPTATYNGIMNNTIIRSIDLGNLPNGTYTISINVIANTNNRTFVIYYYNNGVLDTVNNIITTINGTGQKSYTFTLDGTVTYDDLRFGINSSSVDYSIQLENLMLNKGTTALPYQPYFDGIHNFAWNGIVIKDSNDDTQQTIPIDLSTILYNGNPLFEENALKGVGTAKDYITPYKAYKVVMREKLKNLNWGKVADNVYQCSVSATPKQDDANGRPMTNSLISTNYARVSSYAVTYDNMLDKAYVIGSTYYGVARFYIKDSDYADVTSFKNHFTDNDYIYYELEVPIEVSINWASTLRGIAGYSNGTITLLNTNNMDSANTITYNSIIKENCCAKMVQSRNGSVIKTINFPTQASDGYSAGSVSNVRDFTINKRIGNVSKESNLGSLNWFYGTIAGGSYYGFRVVVSDLKVISISSQLPNLKCAKYNTITPDQSYRGTQGLSCYINTPYIVISDSNYTDATTFGTAMANVPLYYELAESSKTETDITPLEENVIVVQAGDELAFYDSNDNLVTVPTDLTYRIEVAN